MLLARFCYSGIRNRGHNSPDYPWILHPDQLLYVLLKLQLSPLLNVCLARSVTTTIYCNYLIGFLLFPVVSTRRKWKCNALASCQTASCVGGSSVRRRRCSHHRQCSRCFLPPMRHYITLSLAETARLQRKNPGRGPANEVTGQN